KDRCVSCVIKNNYYNHIAFKDTYLTLVDRLVGKPLRYRRTGKTVSNFFFSLATHDLSRGLLKTDILYFNRFSVGVLRTTVF
ncbi:MAG: hypothetical protein Q8M94_02345, partial [Ignavibacteria bacterium]|nr:hypothetical protein [Ignavibacteria bacterium]